MKNCKCRDTITKKQVDYLGRLAELTVEAALGGKNSLSYRVLFRSCCDNLDDDFEEFRYKFVEDMPKDSPAYQQLMEDFMYAVCSGSERPCED